VARVRLACEPQRYASDAQDMMIGHERCARIGDLRPQSQHASESLSHSYSALGACYLSDEAELTIAAIAGDIQDRA